MSRSVRELKPAPSVEQVLLATRECGHVLLFDSADTRSPWSRYSYLMAEPVEIYADCDPRKAGGLFSQLREVLRRHEVERLPGLPPFQGGLAGLCTYEMGHAFEQLPLAKSNGLELPAFWVGHFPWVLAWDHAAKRCWLISHGDEMEFAGELSKFAVFDEDRSARLETPFDVPPRSPNQQMHMNKWVEGLVRINSEIGLGPAERNGLEVFSNKTRGQYLEDVRIVREYIRAGDIYQANLTQQFWTRQVCAEIELYLRLREENAAPFGAYLKAPDWAVLSSSPERFLQLEHDVVTTRPIKGTRPTQSGFEANSYQKEALRRSEKDIAENVMIVDLLRNDLSRVCRAGTVRVPKVCELEEYGAVMHLVSEVRGKLRSGCDFWDLLSVSFPGGSITGAPKIRAMEIIHELERIQRGAYCGSLFWHGYDGACDSSILIRTMTVAKGWVQFPVGGGIVDDSTPQSEYEETLHKARGMLRALTSRQAVAARRNPPFNVEATLD